MINPAESGRKGGKSTRYTYRFTPRDISKATGKTLGAIRAHVYRKRLNLHDLAALIDFGHACRQKASEKEAKANRKKQQTSKKASPPKETGQ